MAIWKNSEMQIFPADGEYISMWKCTVKINDDKILVEYEEGKGYPVEYRGENRGDGHFVLCTPDNKRHATLHRSKDAPMLLEGHWDERSVDNGCGMWRIELVD